MPLSVVGCICVGASTCLLVGGRGGSPPLGAEEVAAGAATDGVSMELASVYSAEKARLADSEESIGSGAASVSLPGLPPPELSDFSTGSASIEAVFRCFRNAEPNAVAKRTLERVLDAHRLASGLTFSSLVSCRGWICRIEAVFDDLEQAKSLFAMPRPP